MATSNLAFSSSWRPSSLALSSYTARYFLYFSKASSVSLSTRSCTFLISSAFSLPIYFTSSTLPSHCSSTRCTASFTVSFIISSYFSITLSFSTASLANSSFVHSSSLFIFSSSPFPSFASSLSISRSFSACFFFYFSYSSSSVNFSPSFSLSRIRSSATFNFSLVSAYRTPLISASLLLCLFCSSILFLACLISSISCAILLSSSTCLCSFFSSF